MKNERRERASEGGKLRANCACSRCAHRFAKSVTRYLKLSPASAVKRRRKVGKRARWPDSLFPRDYARVSANFTYFYIFERERERESTVYRTTHGGGWRTCGLYPTFTLLRDVLLFPLLFPPLLFALLSFSPFFFSFLHVHLAASFLAVLAFLPLPPPATLMKLQPDEYEAK